MAKAILSAASQESIIRFGGGFLSTPPHPHDNLNEKPSGWITAKKEKKNPIF